jgi:hypothetical protein
MIGAAIMIVVTALQFDPYPITEVIIGVATLAVGYMTTTAWEDNATTKANAEVQKAVIVANSTPVATEKQVEVAVEKVMADTLEKV